MKRFVTHMLATFAVLVTALAMPTFSADMDRAEAAVFTQSGMERLLQDQAPIAEIRTEAAEETITQTEARILFVLLLLGLPVLGATLAANKPRAHEGGDRNAYPVIASDILYEGSAIGVVDASGHARPLTAADRFVGFAEDKADNSAGAAAAINVRVHERGKIELSVTGAVITDEGQPVYATDDDTFTFLPTAAAFVGFVHRFVSSGKVIVDFNAGVYLDPYAEYTKRETLSGVKTFDIEDNGKVFFVDAAADGAALTMPAVATPVNITVVAIGAFGTTLVKIDPAAADKIQGPDLPGTDNKDLLLTKATQRRGDFVRLVTGDANGPLVAELRGIWATEA